MASDPAGTADASKVEPTPYAMLIYQDGAAAKAASRPVSPMWLLACGPTLGAMTQEAIAERWPL